MDQSVELKVPEQPQTILWLSTELFDPGMIPGKIELNIQQRVGLGGGINREHRRTTKQRHQWSYTMEDTCSTELK